MSDKPMETTPEEDAFIAPLSGHPNELPQDAAALETLLMQTELWQGVMRHVEAQTKLLDDLRERVNTLEQRDHVRQVHKNRSSALLREMTKDDALRAMNGDLKDLDHRAAANELGLTYAQVYSARMAYTFKPIHRQLEKSGWSNPWKR